MRAQIATALLVLTCASAAEAAGDGKCETSASRKTTHGIIALVECGNATVGRQATLLFDNVSVLTAAQLSKEGLSKDDAAADAAVKALCNEALPADLAKHADVYIRILSGPRADSIFYLVAKAKVAQTRPLVETLAASPDFKDDEGVRIAQAALGNTAVEDSFIEAARQAANNAPPAPRNRFRDGGDAKDGKDLAERLKRLGWIGTRHSLLAACSYARSPLKTYLPDHWEQSVRLDAFRAVQYNFPDERVLVNIDNLSGYAAAERFCSVHLGAVYEGPTPDLPVDMAYPSM